MKNQFHDGLFIFSVLLLLLLLFLNDEATRISCQEITSTSSIPTLFVSVQGTSNKCSETERCTFQQALNTINDDISKYNQVQLLLQHGEYDMKDWQYQLKNKLVIITGEENENNAKIVITSSKDTSKKPIFTIINEDGGMLKLENILFKDMTRTFFSSVSIYDYSLEFDDCEINNSKVYFVSCWYSHLTDLVINNMKITNIQVIEQPFFVVQNQGVLNVTMNNVYTNLMNGFLFHSCDDIYAEVKNSIMGNNKGKLGFSSDKECELLVKNSKFEKNQKGLIHVTAYSIKATFEDNVFNKNTGTILGIVQLRSEDNLISRFTNNQFIMNKHTRSSTLMYQIDGDGHFNVVHKNNKFLNSKCYVDCLGGGAIQFQKISSDFPTETDTKDLEMSKSVVNFKNETFEENEVNNGFGGSIYFKMNDRSFIKMDHCTFNGNMGGVNYDGSGGAISFMSPNTAIEYKVENSVFNYNKASKTGGVFYIEENSTIKFNFSIVNCNFTGNKANKEENVDYEMGGVFFYGKNNDDIDPNMKGVGKNDGYLVIDIVDSIFTENTAKKGGVIANGASEVSLFRRLIINLKNSQFISNQVDFNGGVVYIQQASLNVHECEFIKNIANREGMVLINSSGGVIYSKKSTVNIDDCDFLFNYAKNKGGVLALHSDENLKIMNSNFYNNTCGELGGVVYVKNIISLEISETSDFQNNTAKYGGAIFINEYSNISIKANIQHNVAKIAGGGLYFYEFPPMGSSFSGVSKNYASNGNDILTAPRKVQKGEKGNALILCEMKIEVKEKFLFSCEMKSIEFLDFYSTTIKTETWKPFSIQVSFPLKKNVDYIKNISILETKDVFVMALNNSCTGKKEGKIKLLDSTLKVIVDFGVDLNSITSIIVACMGGVVVLFFIVTCGLVTCDIILSQRLKKNKYIVLN